MSIELPKAISNYFVADAEKNAAGVAGCFTPDAIVVDEREEYRGQDAIRKWKTDSEAKFSYTVEPFAIENKGGRMIVTSHLKGNFPGSPVDLRYLFVLEGEKIAALEIVP